MDLQALRQAITTGATGESTHAVKEAAADSLLIGEIWQSISEMSARVIEDYPQDSRGASCLLLSFVDTRPIHTVVAFPAKRYAGQRQLVAAALLITVYRPDERPHEWTSDYQTRIP